MNRIVKGLSISIILVITLWFLNNSYYNSSKLYGMREQKWHKAESIYKNLSTDELIKIITIGYGSQKNNLFDLFKPKQYPHIAKKVLASRNDPSAIQILTEIINNDLEGNKWEVIGEIGRKRNSVMVPVLCEVLKRHTHWHTDTLIVKALINIDDPSALDCLLEEKDKVRLYEFTRVQLEKTIQKWSKK